MRCASSRYFRARLNRLIRGQEDHTVFVGGGQKHPLALQTAKPGGFQIRDDDDLPANEFFRRVVVSNTGANLPVFTAKIDLKYHEFVRIGVRFGAFDRCHFEFDLSKGVYRNHAASSIDLAGRIAEQPSQKKKHRSSKPKMREISGLGGPSWQISSINENAIAVALSLLDSK
jgi:hypothetical protein